MDFSYLLAISDGDQDFIIEFVDTFDRNTKMIISGIKNAATTGDLDSQKKLAHQLKPSLEMLGLPSLQTAKDLQDDPTTVSIDRVDQMDNECKQAVVEMKAEFNL